MSRARKYCSVYGCLNSTVIKPELSYFTLPKDAERRSKWLHLISREDLSYKPATSNTVCEEHFNAHDIIPDPHRKKLKATALPSLHLPTLQKREKETQTQALTYLSKYVQTEKETEDVTDNTIQTNLSLSSNTPRKRKLKLELAECRKKIKMNEIDNQSDKYQKDTFHKLCDKFLTKELAELVKAQTYLQFHCTGNRHNQDYIMFCLNLYYTSSQAYRLLRSSLCLPCPSTLSKYYIPITTEIDERVILALKTRVKNMTEQEKNCSILLDAMSLKANLFYDIKKDKIFGFHEIDGVQSVEPTKNALVVLIRGIFIDWKQPIAFALLSECLNYEEQIIKWIDKLLEKLFEIGLNIRTFNYISDMGSDLLKAANERSVTVEKPYFFVNFRKIYYIFDAPHLIKSVHNNLILHNFHFQNRVAKYDHILQFYNQDKQKNCKLAPKLTNSHVNPINFEKMNVCYATQLLSNSVATGISTYVDFNAIDETGRDTVHFIKLMNNLFDALNSSNLKDDYEYRRAFCGKESQVEFLKEMLAFFQNLKLINPKNGLNVTSNIKFIQGFQITIKSILLLFEDLKLEGSTFLMTKRLNQEALENLFGQIRARNGMSTKPTTKQFMSAFRKLFFCNIIKPLKGGNYADLGKALIDRNSLGQHNSNETSSNEQNRISDLDREVNDIQISSSEYNQLDFPEKDSLIYICGYLLRKCCEIHRDCQILKSYIKPSLDPRIHNFSTDTKYLRYRDYSKDMCTNLLIVPSDDFVNYVEKLEERLQLTFQKKYINHKILSSIYKEINEISLSALPCPCFPIRYLKKLFIRMRIFYIIKFNNREFRTSQNRRKYFSVFNI